MNDPQYLAFQSSLKKSFVRLHLPASIAQNTIRQFVETKHLGSLVANNNFLETRSSRENRPTDLKTKISEHGS